MNKEDICFMSAVDMAEKIKSQELTSLEITETINANIGLIMIYIPINIDIDKLLVIDFGRLKKSPSNLF